jgi:hypothetical protein
VGEIAAAATRRAASALCAVGRSKTACRRTSCCRSNTSYDNARATQGVRFQVCPVRVCCALAPAFRAGDAVLDGAASHEHVRVVEQTMTSSRGAEY